MLKGRTVIGVAAGRFHTVLWTREAVYTMGLNGGQLGKVQLSNVSKSQLGENQPLYTDTKTPLRNKRHFF